MHIRQNRRPPAVSHRIPRFRGTLGVCASALMLLFLSACAGVDGDVVRVTTVEKNAAYTGLKADEIAKVQEVKKSIAGKDADEGLNSLLAKTRIYDVQEYLAKFPESRSAALADYKVGGYDVLSVTVYEEKDLTLESVRVSADGFITFPLIGRIHVADKTTAEIEKLISRKLADGQYLNEAHVSVMVTKYEGRKYSVLGAVKSPGPYPLQARERILDGISKAGGVDTEKGEKQDAMIIRTLNYGRDNETKIVISFDLYALLKGSDQISNLYLNDQDVVYIPKADYFYIIGQVKNPGSYAFTKRDITIVEAISIAGGFTPIAARNKTRIVRIENGTEKIYEINVDSITKGGKIIQAVAIKPNDLIVVPESFF
ncbi:MAG TPA: polysaccharide biosynthesis/export family protein [Syntrophales bacterium]|nr:polysaccharide biosynthesis/export family protein [Syntrophales bacterium]